MNVNKLRNLLRTTGALLSVLALAWISTGCVTSGRGDKMEGDIRKLQEELAVLQKDRDSLNNYVERTKKELAELEAKSIRASERLAQNGADLGAEMLEVRKAIDKLNGDMGQFQREHKKLAKDYEVFRTDVDVRLAEAASAPPALPSDKKGLWDAANRFYNEGDSKNAAAAFSQYAKSFAKDRKADDAIRMHGDILVKKGSYAEAVYEYKKVLGMKRSDQVDAANLGIGEAFVGLGNCKDALIFFEDAAGSKKRAVRDSAKKRLNQVKKTCK